MILGEKYTTLGSSKLGKKLKSSLVLGKQLLQLNIQDILNNERIKAMTVKRSYLERRKQLKN